MSGLSFSSEERCWWKGAPRPIKLRNKREWEDGGSTISQLSVRCTFYVRSTASTGSMNCPGYSNGPWCLPVEVDTSLRQDNCSVLLAILPKIVKCFCVRVRTQRVEEPVPPHSYAAFWVADNTTLISSLYGRTWIDGVTEPWLYNDHVTDQRLGRLLASSVAKYLSPTQNAMNAIMHSLMQYWYYT